MFIRNIHVVVRITGGHKPCTWNVSNTWNKFATKQTRLHIAQINLWHIAFWTWHNRNYGDIVRIFSFIIGKNNNDICGSSSRKKNRKKNSSHLKLRSIQHAQINRLNVSVYLHNVSREWRQRLPIHSACKYANNADCGVRLLSRNVKQPQPNRIKMKLKIFSFGFSGNTLRFDVEFAFWNFKENERPKGGGKDNSTRRSDMSVKIFSFLLKQFSGCSPGNDPPDGTIAMHREFSSGRKYFVYSVFCPQQHQRKEMYNLNAFLPQSIAV